MDKVKKTVNYKQIFAIKNKNKEIIKKHCPKATDTSGIYIFHRVDENGIKYAYIGLASKSLLQRLAEHLSGRQQWIDISILKHKLYDEKTNPYGYKIDIVCTCPPEELDEKETYYIKLVSEKGYQLRNTQSGSREKGRYNINENKPARGYRDGLRQGYINAQREVSKWFEKSLDFTIKGKTNLNKQKAFEKFIDFLKIDKK